MRPLGSSTSHTSLPALAVRDQHQLMPTANVGHGGHCADGQQPADVGLTGFGHPAESFLASRRELPGPSQAAKSHPHLKLPIAGAKASIARAVIGPMPGIVWSRRATSLSRERSAIFLALSSILAVFSLIRSDSKGSIPHLAISPFSTGSIRGLDILVNNAGIMFEKTVEETSEEDWDLMMAINLKAPFLLTKRAVPYLRQRGGGSIINIGSIEGLASSPGHPAYSASKAGIHGFTAAIAVDQGHDGIRCNAYRAGLDQFRSQ